MAFLAKLFGKKKDNTPAEEALVEEEGLTPEEEAAAEAAEAALLNGEEITDEEFKAELESLETLYREHTGREMAKYYRPPEGRFDRRTMEYAHTLGYKTIFWSFAYADWDNNSQMSRESAKRKIMDNIHNGAVILLHPTSATNADILGEVIRELKAEGYRFGTLDELTANV